MDNKNLTIGIFITLTLLSSGAYFLTDEDHTYYCESRDLVGICEKLSSGLGTRCYFEETYKNCAEGWKKISDFIEIEPEIIYTSNNSYSNQVKCDKDGCK